MTTLHHETFGDPRQPAMLLIEGLGAHLIGWRRGFCELLVAGGFHVIRFDNRDVGLSPRFPAGGYSLADMAADTVGLLDQLGIDSAHVVGQSMGGMIAQHLGAEHADRVRSLALLYTCANLDHVIGLDALDDRMDAPLPRTREEAAELHVRNEELCASTAYPRDLEWLREAGALMFDRGYDPDGVQRQAEAVVKAPDRTELLSRITAPVTLIHGSADRLIGPAASAHLHANLPGSALTVHDGMGHELPKALWPELTGQILRNASSSAIAS